MRTLASRLLASFIVALAALGVLAPPAGAAGPSCDNEAGCVLVVGVTGLIDPVIAEYLRDTTTSVRSVDGFLGIVVVLDSAGVVIDDAAFARLVATLRDSDVPVSAWVGPSGAEATGGAAELALALGRATAAPGTRIGDNGTQRLPLDRFGDLFEGAAAVLRTEAVDAEQAGRSGAIAGIDNILGDHVLDIEGVTFDEVADAQGRPKRAPRTTGITQTLPLGDQLFHTVASPAVAYLLLAVAIGLLIFEFFTAGVGVAGVIGAGAGVLAAYGLDVLPTRPWALALCLVAGLAFAIDVQTALPRVWTGIGLVLWTAGSFLLFEGMHTPWLALVTGVVGMAISMVSGMPAMVRSRFGTPTIGRGWMVGREGRTVSEVDPDGIVVIDGAQWRARTNRATPLGVGDEIRVVAIDGLTLEVEPLEGGAIDYREMRGRRSEPARDA